MPRGRNPGDLLGGAKASFSHLASRLRPGGGWLRLYFQVAEVFLLLLICVYAGCLGSCYQGVGLGAHRGIR